MAFSHGRTAVFKITDSGSTLRDISAYLMSDGLSREADTAETSVFGNTSKTYVAGLLDGTISIEGLFDPTVDGYLAGILGSSKAFELYPDGTATGKVKYTGSAILTSYEGSSEIGDASKISGEFQITGDVTRALVP